MEEARFSPRLEEFDAVATSVQARLSCANCLISVIETDVLHALGITDGEGRPGNRRVLAANTICQHTVSLGHPVQINDVRGTPWLQHVPTVEEFDIGGYLGVPVTLSDGHTVGAICALSSAPRDWQEEEVEYLSEMARLAASRIEVHLQDVGETVQSEAEDEADRIIGALAQLRSAAISVHDPDGELLFANRGMADQLGLTASDLLNLPTQEILTLGSRTPSGGMQVRMQTEQGCIRWLRVEWSRTLGGLTLCDWTACDPKDSPPA